LRKNLLHSYTLTRVCLFSVLLFPDPVIHYCCNYRSTVGHLSASIQSTWEPKQHNKIKHFHLHPNYQYKTFLKISVHTWFHIMLMLLQTICMLTGAKQWTAEAIFIYTQLFWYCFGWQSRCLEWNA